MTMFIETAVPRIAIWPKPARVMMPWNLFAVLIAFVALAFAIPTAATQSADENTPMAMIAQPGL